MTRPFQLSTARITRGEGIERAAKLFDGTRLRFGVHGPIKSYYRLDGEPDLPLPVDYIAAAAGG